MIRGESIGFVKLENIGEQQCELMFVTHTDARGHIPAAVIDRTIPRMLHSVFQIRETFNRDDEIDKIEREKVMGKMAFGETDDDERYSAEEDGLLNRICGGIGSVSDDHFTELCSPDSRTMVSEGKSARTNLT